MARRSQAWKNLERQVAKALGGKRVCRGANFSVSDVDVDLSDIPYLKIDAKYRKRHSHHSFMEEIKEKYCNEGDIPVLVTKHHYQDGAYVTVDLEFFSILLMAFRKNLKLEPTQ